jgi:hypothetical protein
MESTNSCFAIKDLYTHICHQVCVTVSFINHEALLSTQFISNENNDFDFDRNSLVKVSYSLFSCCVRLLCLWMRDSGNGICQKHSILTINVINK